MLRKITLHNFMAHAHTEIALAEGVTVLVGPNNSGKSAVAVALQAMMANDIKPWAIRHGERETSVSVETSEGNVITCRRGHNGAGTYTLDGVEYTRTGGSVPPDVAAVLRLGPAGSADRPVDIHFGEQKDPIITVLTDTGTAAAFFAASSDARLMLLMQKRHNDNTRKRRMEQDRIAREVDRMVRREAHLAPAEAAIATLARIENGLMALEHAEDVVGEGMRLAGAMATTTAAVGLGRGRTACLARLAPPPVLVDERPLVGLMKSMTAEHTRRVRMAGRSTALRGLAAPPPQIPEAPLATAVKALEMVEAEVRRLLARHRTTSRLAPVPAMADEATLAAMARDLGSATVATQRGARRLATLGAMQRPPELADTAPLAAVMGALVAAGTTRRREAARAAALAAVRPAPVPLDVAPVVAMIESLAASAAAVDAARSRMASAQTDLADVHAAIEQWARANPNCPTCGGAVDAQRLIAGGHRHGG